MNILRLLENMSRRNFLRRTGSAAVSAATGTGPLGVASKLLGGPSTVVKDLSGISDEELASTPEEEWLPYISHDRVKNMIEAGKYSPGIEILNKAAKMVLYGDEKPQLPGVMKLLAKAIKGTSADDPQALVNDFMEYGQYELTNVVDMAFEKSGHAGDAIRAAQDFAHKLWSAANENGVNIPLEPLKRGFSVMASKHYASIMDADRWNDIDGQPPKAAPGQNTDDAEELEDYDVDDDYKYASSMHQPFEGAKKRKTL